MAYYAKKARVGKAVNKIPKAWRKNQSAGKDWYYLYKERHGELSLRKPEALGRHRAIMGNDAVLDRYV